jgi:hypothetical protein
MLRKRKIEKSRLFRGAQDDRDDGWRVLTGGDSLSIFFIHNFDQGEESLQVFLDKTPVILY